MRRALVLNREEDYSRVLESMAVEALPSTYACGFRTPNKSNREEDWGFKVYRAVIDPNKFPVWCAANGMDVDAQGRTAFAKTYARNETRPIGRSTIG